MSHEIGWFTIICIAMVVCSCALWAINGYRRALAKARSEIGYTGIDVLLYCAPNAGFSFGLVGGLLSWTKHSSGFSFMWAIFAAGVAILLTFVYCIINSPSVIGEVPNINRPGKNLRIVYKLHGSSRPSESGERIQRHRFQPRHMPHKSRRPIPPDLRDKNRVNPKYRYVR